MMRMTPDTAVAMLEIQQLVAEWGYDLDKQGGMNVAALCTRDCRYMVGGIKYEGPDAITGFYAARNDRVAAQQRDGVRTQRHTVTNQRTRFAADDADRAETTFLLVNYSKEGKPPALDLVGPTIVADCTMTFHRGGDGAWRIASFDSVPVFIGNDPFLNASVVPR